MGNITGVIFAVAVFTLLLLALREVLTWYWKLNKIVSLLEQIEENTRPKATPEQASAVRAQEMEDAVHGKIGEAA